MTSLKEHANPNEESNKRTYLAPLDDEDQGSSQPQQNSGSARSSISSSSCNTYADKLQQTVRVLWGTIGEFITKYTVIKKKLLTITMYLLFCCIMSSIYIGWEYNNDRDERESFNTNLNLAIKDLESSCQMLCANSRTVVDFRRAARSKFDEMNRIVLDLGFMDYRDVTWTYARAYYFVMTTTAAIGYGYPVPKTAGGRITTLFMFVFGVPFAFLALFDFVDLLLLLEQNIGSFMKKGTTKQIKRVMTRARALSTLLHKHNEVHPAKDTEKAEETMKDGHKEPSEEVDGHSTQPAIEQENNKDKSNRQAQNEQQKQNNIKHNNEPKHKQNDKNKTNHKKNNTDRPNSDASYNNIWSCCCKSKPNKVSKKGKESLNMNTSNMNSDLGQFNEFNSHGNKLNNTSEPYMPEELIVDKIHGNRRVKTSKQKNNKTLKPVRRPLLLNTNENYTQNMSSHLNTANTSNHNTGKAKKSTTEIRKPSITPGREQLDVSTTNETSVTAVKESNVSVDNNVTSNPPKFYLGSSSEADHEDEPEKVLKDNQGKPQRPRKPKKKKLVKLRTQTMSQKTISKVYTKESSVAANVTKIKSSSTDSSSTTLVKGTAEIQRTSDHQNIPQKPEKQSPEDHENRPYPIHQFGPQVGSEAGTMLPYMESHHIEKVHYHHHPQPTSYPEHHPSHIHHSEYIHNSHNIHHSEHYKHQSQDQTLEHHPHHSGHDLAHNFSVHHTSHLHHSHNPEHHHHAEYHSEQHPAPHTEHHHAHHPHRYDTSYPHEYHYYPPYKTHHPDTAHHWHVNGEHHATQRFPSHPDYGDGFYTEEHHKLSDHTVTTTAEDDSVLLQQISMVFTFTNLLIYIFLGAFMYIQYEHWTYLESVYFIMTSISTVGYGDFLPKNSEMELGTAFFVLFGLALLAKIVTAIKDKIQNFLLSTVQKFENATTHAKQHFHLKHDSKTTELQTVVHHNSQVEINRLHEIHPEEHKPTTTSKLQKHAHWKDMEPEF